MSLSYKLKIYTRGGDNAARTLLWCGLLKYPVNNNNQVVHMRTQD